MTTLLATTTTSASTSASTTIHPNKQEVVCLLSDLDSSEDEEEEEQQAEVHWRDGTGETTLAIVAKNSDVEELYATHSVHPRVLCRTSQYFQKLLQDGRTTTTRRSSITIELVPLAVSAFPLLLDFLYHPYQPLAINITTQTATALMYLAYNFQVPLLVPLVEKFCQQDISAKTLDLYFYQSLALSSKTQLMDTPPLWMNFVVHNLSQITTQHAVVQKSNKELWITLAKTVDLCQEKSLCKHFTKLFAEFVTHNATANHLDATTFHTILSADTTPFIHPDVALTLAELNHKQFPPPKDEFFPQRSLRNRCARAFSNRWNQVMASTTTEKQSALQRLRGLDPLFLVDVMEFVHDASSTAAAPPIVSEQRKNAESPRRAALKNRIGKEPAAIVEGWYKAVLKNKSKELQALAKMFGPFATRHHIAASREYQMFKGKYNDLAEDYDLVLAVKYAKGAKRVHSSVAGDDAPPHKKAKTSSLIERVSKPASVRELELPSTAEEWTIPKPQTAKLIKQEANKRMEQNCSRRGSKVMWVGYHGQEEVQRLWKIVKSEDTGAPEDGQNSEETPDVYFYCASDNVDYPVKVVQMFPDGKCWIRFKGYGSVKLVAASQLMRGTRQRVTAYNAWRTIAVQHWL